MMTPPMQPVLRDARVVLRPMTAQDWDALYAVAADPAIWALHPAHDRWQRPVFRTYFDDALATRGALVILDRATTIMIGASRYDGDNAEPGEVEIGWTFLARSHWGGPYNRSVKRLMLAHAFTVFDAVIFSAGADNVISRRALDNIGAVLTDRRRMVMLGGGAAVAHVIYRISRDQFLHGPLNRSR